MTAAFESKPKRRALFAFCLFILMGSSFVVSSITEAATDQNNEDASKQVQQFGDWFYRCIDNATGLNQKNIKQCEIAQIQQAKNAGQNVPILSIAVTLAEPDSKSKNKTPGFILTSVAPLNVYLPKGLSFYVQNKNVLKLTYTNCNQTGCWARQTLDKTALQNFKKSTNAKAHFGLADGRDVYINFSLKGFSAALSAMQNSEISKTQ